MSSGSGLTPEVGHMDRIGTAKLQIEDFAQLSDRLTSEKYRGSLESAGKLILRYSSNADNGDIFRERGPFVPVIFRTQKI